MGNLNTYFNDFYNILSMIISVIGVFFVLPGVFKIIAGFRNSNGDELHAGGKDVVLGAVFLFFGVFILPTLQNVQNNLSSSSGNTTSFSVESALSEDDINSTSWQTDTYITGGGESYTWDDASNWYQTFTIDGGGIYGTALKYIYHATSSATDIMAGAGEGSYIATIQSALTSFVKNAIEGLKPVGFAITLLFFLTSVIELAKEERLTIETFIKHFARFFIAAAFIVNADKIYGALYNIGNELGVYLQTYLESTGATYSDSTDWGNYMARKLFEADVASLPVDGSLDMVKGIVNLASVLPSGLLICLAASAMLAVMYFISFSRLLEMSIRGIFIPVAMGLLADDGWRGAGGRYLKKFLAVCAQVAVLVAISSVATYIITSASDSILGGDDIMGALIILLGIGFSMVSVMFKSIGITNDVFGA